MPDDVVLCEVSDGLALVTLNRPDARNPLDGDTATRLLEIFDELFGDDAVRTIAVTGSGKAFSAGGDLTQLRDFSRSEAARTFAWAAPTVELSRRMIKAPKPVIAAVNGAAYGGGMGLAGMCDIVLATNTARFALPEVKIGLFPIVVVAHLCRAIPRKRLMEMMLTGEPLSADEAYRIGFVNRVYDDQASLLTGVREFAGKLAKASPDAMRLGRRTFAILSEVSAEQALDISQFMLMPFHLGRDLQEGADAFLSRRTPSWAETPTPPPGGRPDDPPEAP